MSQHNYLQTKWKAIETKLKQNWNKSRKKWNKKWTQKDEIMNQKENKILLSIKILTKRKLNKSFVETF